MTEKRWWEIWDEPGMAEFVDARIRRCEMEHHQALGAQVCTLIETGEKFLEVGCGSGLMYACMPGLNYTGVDNSREMLAIAQRNFPDGRFKYGDIYKLRYKDDRFDVVGAFGVLGHVPDIEQPVSEILRVASRLALFTVWPAEKTETQTLTVRGHEFLRSRYAHDDIIALVGERDVTVWHIGKTMLYAVAV
jgi:ubiquinone/menaquinone biosynthesis C-methylase UbiE